LVDFRYHLVTIIAIFLALAVGIVVGTAALNGPVLDGLRRSNAGLISDKRALESDVRELQGEVDTADDFTRLLSGDLVGGLLDGERVLLVLAPDADRQVADQLAATLTEAGAQVTGRLALQPDLLDPEQRQLVDDLVAQVVPAGLELPEGSAVARASVELAAALLVPPGEEPIDRDAAQQVVSAFEEAGLVELRDEGEQITPATVAVLLAGAPPAEEQDDDAQTQREGLLSLARALDGSSGGAVVAGPPEAALEGGLVRALRADDALDAEISTVDNADRALGHVAVVRALVEQLQGGAGRYGSSSGATPVPVSGVAPAQTPDAAAAAPPAADSQAADPPAADPPAVDPPPAG
jgi:hypothetical protein